MTKELSIFIDESGDFGEYAPHSPYYIIGLVIHEQNKDISAQVAHFDRLLKEMDFREDFVHIGPLIRREAGYKNLTSEERVRILRKNDGLYRTDRFFLQSHSGGEKASCGLC